MAVYLVPLLASMLLVAAPDVGDEPDLTDAEMLSTAAGGILGAAAMCREIPGDRVKAAADQVDTLVSAVIGDDDELTSANELFIKSAGEGKAALASGRTDCRTVEAALTRLERLGDRPPRQ
jgi:branched-chain amino acid transport system substrate-binding protein